MKNLTQLILVIAAVLLLFCGIQIPQHIRTEKYRSGINIYFPAFITRRTVLQKVRRCTYKVLRQLVNTGFQVLFHSPPGVLFTFPSQYYALSVTE